MENVICRELTWMGWIYAAWPGFMELAFVFLVLGISWRMTPGTGVFVSVAAF